MTGCGQEGESKRRGACHLACMRPNRMRDDGDGEAVPTDR